MADELPDDTAVRVALWRAMHVQVDPPPHVLTDEIGLQLVPTTAATLRQIAGFAPGSTLAMTFLLPIELLDEADRPGLEMSARGACAAGTPFVGFYSPREIVAVARAAGFPEARHVSGTSLAERYFADRTDGLRPSTGEDLLVAGT